MTHRYHITGMTCSSCQIKVQTLLEKVRHVENVAIDLPKGEAVIQMNAHVATNQLQDALKDYPQYQLSPMPLTEGKESAHEEASWWSTYKPVLLVFSYITGITLLLQVYIGQFSWETWMNNFMAGFFLVFSFFKLLNLSAFAESYAMYDVVARRWAGWGYVYAFIELGLGILFLLRWNPLVTNSITLSIMTVSIIGVLQSILNKRKIRCACLGAVFNLPMSTITIIEDGLMIGMSAVMLANMI